MKSTEHIMDEGSGEEYDSNLLIRVCNLTKGPLLSRRKEIRKAIVRGALSIYQSILKIPLNVRLMMKVSYLF